MTKIQWTDESWNPVTGCTKISAGCEHCYAERVFPRVYSPRKFTDVQCHTERLDVPLHWRKPRRVFVNSMSDLFHEDVPFEFIASIFAIMGVTTRHTYQVLTKRPKRMLEFFEWAHQEQDEDGAWYPINADDFSADSRIFDYWPKHIPLEPLRGNRGGYDNCGPAYPYKNVWLGVSVEDQATADERIPLLLSTPAAGRFVSYEPALGPVSLRNITPPGRPMDSVLPLAGLTWTASPSGARLTGKHAALDWIIVGGESGPKARPFDVQWARDIRDQCRAAGVAFFMKQMSGKTQKSMPPIPDDLFIREYPNANT